MPSDTQTPTNDMPPELEQKLQEQEQMFAPLVAEYAQRKGGKILTEEEVAQMQQLADMADELMLDERAYPSMLKAVAQHPDPAVLVGQMAVALGEEVINRAKQQGMTNISTDILMPLGLYIISRIAEAVNNAAGKPLLTEEDMALALFQASRDWMNMHPETVEQPDPEMMAAMPKPLRRNLGDVLGKFIGLDKATGRNV